MLWWGKRKKNLRRDKNDLNASSRIRFVSTEYVNLIDRSNRFDLQQNWRLVSGQINWPVQVGFDKRPKMAKA